MMRITSIIMGNHQYSNLITTFNLRKRLKGVVASLEKQEL